MTGYAQLLARTRWWLAIVFTREVVTFTASLRFGQHQITLLGDTDTCDLKADHP